LVLEIEPVRKRFLTNLPQRFEVAKDRVLLHGAVIEIDDATGKALKIQRVSEMVSS
jgi:calcineurin-like phosphoesterase